MDETEKRREIYSQVLERLALIPEIEKRLRSTVDFILDAVRDEAEATGTAVEPVLVGSVAKGTWAGEPDIDVFMLFDPDISKDVMEQWGLRTGKKILPEWEERYAEHPYIHGYLNGFEVDLVPAYKIRITERQGIISSVDRTPLHTDFVIGHLSEEQRDEVRLLKRFMKGVETYGADVRTEGFSGYLCELLVIKYGDFESVLRASDKWKNGTALSMEDRPQKRFDEPLVFVDPVDAGRNVASALSLETMSRFIHAAREFLISPSMEFFFPPERPPLSVEKLAELYENRGTEIILISTSRPQVIDDILYPQVKKLLRSVVRGLETEDFRPLGTAYTEDENGIYMLVELETASLPAVKKHEGPPVWVKNSAEFLERWKGNCLNGPYIEGGRWFADIRRRYPDALAFLKERFSGPLGKDIPPANSMEKLGNLSQIQQNVALLLTEYLDKKFPWER